VRTQLAQQRQALHTYQDHTVFERSELLTRTGSPYTVFTPYKKAWLARIDDARLAPASGTTRRKAGATACRTLPPRAHAARPGF
jgi:deoxyribodipyrimidine photo-lyase